MQGSATNKKCFKKVKKKKKKKTETSTQRGARTQDPDIKSLMIYRLSQPGTMGVQLQFEFKTDGKYKNLNNHSCHKNMLLILIVILVLFWRRGWKFYKRM